MSVLFTGFAVLHLAISFFFFFFLDLDDIGKRLPQLAICSILQHENVNAASIAPSSA